MRTGADQKLLRGRLPGRRVGQAVDELNDGAEQFARARTDLEQLGCPDPDLVIRQVHRLARRTTLVADQALAVVLGHLSKESGQKSWPALLESLPEFVDSFS